MERYPCPSCGREIEPAPRCPYCNAEQGKWADEVSRIEREIAEIRKQDIKLARDQRLLAQRMNAAQFQRDILAAANQERIKEQRKKPRRVLRRRATRRPPTADPTGPRIPRQQPTDRVPPEAPPPPRVQDLDEEGLREEASPREIQNVYLGLGALLLGVAAVVFAGVTPYAIPRLAILAGAAALMLGVAPFVRARQLSSTAETVSAVGLTLVPLIGYALYLVPAVSNGPLAGEVFGGIVFAVTAAIAAVYASATGLSVPRYATVLALQPVIPLLAHRWIDGPTGWAFSLAAVAAMDVWLGRQYAAFGALVPPAWSARLVTPPATVDEPPAARESTGVRLGRRTGDTDPGTGSATEDPAARKTAEPDAQPGDDGTGFGSAPGPARCPPTAGPRCPGSCRHPSRGSAPTTTAPTTGRDAAPRKSPSRRRRRRSRSADRRRPRRRARLRPAAADRGRRPLAAGDVVGAVRHRDRRRPDLRRGRARRGRHRARGHGGRHRAGAGRRHRAGRFAAATPPPVARRGRRG